VETWAVGSAELAAEAVRLDLIDEYRLCLQAEAAQRTALISFGYATPNWTRTNFNKLREVSPSDVPIQWRFARNALESPELGVSRFTYEPGARMPWGHRHHEQEEVYVVVAGSGQAKLDDDVIDLEARDALRVAPAVIRSFEAGPTGLDMICIGGRKPKGPDTERHPDFWK
jgi:mannose-6-phosphate isomerase-like protein (cupin superfamily)